MLSPVLLPFALLLPMSDSMVQFIVSLSSSVIVTFSVSLVVGTPVLVFVGISKLSAGLVFVVLKVYIALVYWYPSVTFTYHVYVVWLLRFPLMLANMLSPVWLLLLLLLPMVHYWFVILL